MKKKSKKQSRSEQAIFHTDSWKNMATGLGTPLDKSTHAKVHWIKRDPKVYQELYSADELASRICNVVPEEALRKFVEWTGVEADQADEVVKRCEDLDLRGALERTWKWGRAYGGAILYVVTDTSTPGEPMQPGETVIALRDLSRHDLRVMATDVENDFGHPNYGLPIYYHLSLTMGIEAKVYPIHSSRVIRFDGELVPRRTFIDNNFWHDSILNRLFGAIRNYQMANDAAASVMQDFNMGVFKMKNLASMMAAKQSVKIRERLEIAAFSKSTIKCMILDAENEDYIDLSRNVSGMPEMLEKMANRLVAATDIPHTKLLGESPDGSNATGNSTTQGWFDHIQAQQENYLRPKLRALVDMVFPDLKDQLGFKFKSLYQMTELEEAELRNKQSQTDAAYISAGVLDPTEVAMSRFGGDQYSIETELDMDARDAGLIGGNSLPQSSGNDFGQSGDDNGSDSATGHDPNASTAENLANLAHNVNQTTGSNFNSHNPNASVSENLSKLSDNVGKATGGGDSISDKLSDLQEAVNSVAGVKPQSVGERLQSIGESLGISGETSVNAGESVSPNETIPVEKSHSNYSLRNNLTPTDEKDETNVSSVGNQPYKLKDWQMPLPTDNQALRELVPQQGDGIVAPSGNTHTGPQPPMADILKRLQKLSQSI